MIFGADYYPEQWPPGTWHEDVVLMRQAGVNLVNVNTFSWASLEPEPGRFEFAELDKVMDLLSGAGIGASLATPTAAPPAWFLRRHPRVLPVTSDGVTLGTGARESFCPSAPEYRRAAAGITRALAERYREHPALRTWHVNNEYGAHAPLCYCDRSAAAFRSWLARAYGSVTALNDAWGTVFWGQTYTQWEEINPPRRAPMPVNTTQRLDFLRFSNDEYIACFRTEADILRAVTPGIPVSTNFMVGEARCEDYWTWAGHVDYVGTSSYLQTAESDSHVLLAMYADLARGVAGGHPWLLMEHATGAVNWRPRNPAKMPGQMRRNTLAHIARGSDGAMFFQWRASRFGTEKFHSAMLPQAHTDTAVWRDVVALGADVRALSEIRSSRVLAEVAIAWDWQSWWAMEFEDKPSCDLRYVERMRAYYRALWGRKVTIDIVHPGAALDAYRLLVLPSLYLLDEACSANLRDYVAAGGCVLVSYFSGIVDRNDHVYPGPYPGALREVLGLYTEEFHPLGLGEQVLLSDGTTAGVWSERVVTAGAEPELTFASGPDAGEPAVTRHTFGAGSAWYVAARLEADALSALLAKVLTDAGVRVADWPEPVEAVVRRGEHAEYLFLINHDRTGAHRVTASGTDLLSGTVHDGSIELQPSQVAVLRRRRGDRR
ncbi:beta-galactosidase [Actinoplanes sp. NPDC026670]|uniref:beta-galactosidase n=1 Tax=Actinoplanes sp. NPDC026670 TaxID=3154700 RepID=UPI00340681FE